MKRWQQAWLWLALVASLLHALRDWQQTIGIQTILSTTLVKSNGTHEGIWSSANTVVIETLMLVSSIYLLRRGEFGRLGYLTLLIAAITFAFFVVYWFFV